MLFRNSILPLNFHRIRFNGNTNYHPSPCFHRGIFYYSSLKPFDGKQLQLICVYERLSGGLKTTLRIITAETFHNYKRYVLYAGSGQLGNAILMHNLL